MKSSMTGELFVAVEGPRFPRGYNHRLLPSPADVMAASHSPYFVGLGVRTCIYAHEVLVAGVRKPIPLEEALRLLDSEESPEAELARRRAEVAAEVAAAEKAAEKARADHDQALRDNRQWRERNATEIAAFSQLTPLLQSLAVAAEEHPDFRPFVRAAIAQSRQHQYRGATLPKWMEAPLDP
jgi:hypothetical protein